MSLPWVAVCCIVMVSQCLASDVCRGAANDGNGPNQPCPADPATGVGYCPSIPARYSCNAGDQCASGLNTTVPCPATGTAQDSNTANCPDLAVNATCNILITSGSCGDDQACNAPVYGPYNVQQQYDATPGVCVDNVASGKPCKAGYDLCETGSAVRDDAYCMASTCALSRPDWYCLNGVGICSSGSSGTTVCPDDHGRCPPVVEDGGCLAGDTCTAPQVCNAVGTAAGKCVTPPRPGAACKKGSDMCVVSFYNLEVADDYQSEVQCYAATCPFASAGHPCDSSLNDVCSDGASGTGCPATSNTCPTLAAGAKCYLPDLCMALDGVPQFCNATGTAAGVCTPATPAGNKCTANLDVCSPFGHLCTSGTCPVAYAGSDCEATDLCNSGTATGVPCPTDTKVCPPLATGLPCSDTDLCVRGAMCVGATSSASGTCLPNDQALAAKAAAAAATNQGAASSTTPSGNAAQTASAYSTAATVPAVQSVALLSAYLTTDLFNTSERVRFINTLEANILAKINALTNVTITKVVPGSISVTNSVAFTAADSSAAAAGQSALATLLSSSNGISTVFGSSFGTVSVSNITQANTTNPAATSGVAATGLAGALYTAMALAALLMSI